MSKNKQNRVDRVEVEPVVEVTEVVEAEVAETPEVVVEPEVIVKAFGEVTNCSKLNIRKNPTTDADVLCVVEKGTKLVINVDESNDEWHAVETESGVKGFAMKSFVAPKGKGA